MNEYTLKSASSAMQVEASYQNPLQKCPRIESIDISRILESVEPKPKKRKISIHSEAEKQQLNSEKIRAVFQRSMDFLSLNNVNVKSRFVPIYEHLLHSFPSFIVFSIDELYAIYKELYPEKFVLADLDPKDILHALIRNVSSLEDFKRAGISVSSPDVYYSAERIDAISNETPSADWSQLQIERLQACLAALDLGRELYLKSSLSIGKIGFRVWMLFEYPEQIKTVKMFKNFTFLFPGKTAEDLFQKYQDLYDQQLIDAFFAL